MTGKAAGHDEQRIDANIVSVAGITRSKPRGRDRHPTQPVAVEGPIGSLLAAALLDLDECKRSSAAGNKIDFAARNTGAVSKYVPAFEP